MCRALLSFLIAIAVLSPGHAREVPDYEALNRVLTDQVVVPAYEDLAAAMAQLDAATRSFCQTPSESALEAAKDAFDRAMDAWQRAQPIAFGPVTWEGRSSRIEFWPDKGGVAGRQIGQALQAQDPNLIAEGGLVGKSAAVQNLAAYELIVFGRGAAIASDQATAEDRYACALAEAIARYQAELAAQILADWTGPGGHIDAVLTAAQGNEYYAGTDEVATLFLTSLSGALDAVIQLKLERPLGTSIEKARPRRAESWRSGRSLANIIANLQTAQALYGTPGGFGDLLAAGGSEPLDIGLRKSFDEAIGLAEAIDLPLSEAVKSPDARAELDAILDRLRSLRLLISGSVADEIGLVIGFNAFDGD
jgi:predicted lipoprotein